MKEKKSIYNVDDCVLFVQSKSGLAKEVIIKVLALEMEYMCQVGTAKKE